MLMVVVYSGFWILYFQNFGTVLWYLRDVVDKAPVSAAMTALLASVGLHVEFRFDIEHVTVINAGTIVLLQVVVSRFVADRKALPTMIAGMLLGAVGFALLATSTSAWVFIAGIVVFSLGEMTAHPKYYSFIGLVAPPDRKALYMGYAFLYGVFGSLLGSNIGAFLYSRMIEPVLHTAAVQGRARMFWLLFTVLDVCAAGALVLFFRRFEKDTPDTRRSAARAMQMVYGFIILLGGAFLAVGLSGSPVQYRTVVQALIFVTLGVGGIVVNRRGIPA
jgi:POT family proton-dependent oligopeptide transporter